jgi:hypothetical protein
MFLLKKKKKEKKKKGGRIFNKPSPIDIIFDVPYLPYIIRFYVPCTLSNHFLKTVIIIYLVVINGFFFFFFVIQVDI